jgi:hypothetical protein
MRSIQQSVQNGQFLCSAFLGPTASAAMTTKAAQRAELERLVADYDGPIIRDARDQRV